jgi:hypothetical protein
MTTREEVAAKAYRDEGPPYSHENGIAAALAAADAHDAAHGVYRVTLDDATVERAAEAAALVDDHDGCFERIREWEAMEPWEQEAHGYPSDDYEAREYWIKRTRAVLAAAVQEGEG